MFIGMFFAFMAYFNMSIMLGPLLDSQNFCLTHRSRMTVVHRLFSIHYQVSRAFNFNSKATDPDIGALDIMMKVYQPQVNIEELLSKNDMTEFRYHSKRMFTSLHPARSPSCIVKHHIFQYDGNNVSIYFIQHDEVEDWKESDRPFVLYFHGGGFVSGGIDQYGGFECHLSKQLNMLIIHVDFGLAPEYPLAKTMEDVIGVYRILSHFDSKIHTRMIGMGDSTGGMLWIHLLQWMVANNKPVPRGVVLHSPWLNLDFENINFWASPNNYYSFSMMFSCREAVVGRDVLWRELSDEDKRKISPKNNSYEGFPPLYITAGSNEIFSNEIRTMTKTIQLAGGEVILDEGEGAMHSFALFHLWLGQARCSQEGIRRWIDEKISKHIRPTWNSKMLSESCCQ